MQKNVTNMYVLRKQKGISQRDLAQQLGKSQSIISKMENGILANPELLTKIAAILGCTEEFLRRTMHEPSSI